MIPVIEIQSNSLLSMNEEAAQAEAAQALARSRAATMEVHQPPFEARPFVERQAAISMLQLAQNEEAPVSQDAAKNLMYTLTVSSWPHHSIYDAFANFIQQAEAPDGVEKLYAAEDAEEEMNDLEKLIELAQCRIDQLKGNTSADA